MRCARPGRAGTNDSREAIMFRALSILATIVALAVSAAPASAQVKDPPKAAATAVTHPTQAAAKPKQKGLVSQKDSEQI
jgi:hypothetical protein